MNPSAQSIRWPGPAVPLLLPDGAVHVWAVALNVPLKALADFSTTLSPAEKERAGRYKFEVHRNRFIAGRGLLREILGRYLAASPASLEFTTSANGKPSLAGKFSGAGIYFNLAHSEDLALCAVTRAAAVGVDVERVRPMKDVDDLVARFFSPRENAAFRELKAEQRSEAFFNLWTRKEALLKATGEGIARLLGRVEVSFLPGEPARLLAIADDVEKAGRWKLQELSPAPGFVGAVAVQSQDAAVGCHKWE